jgi:hypothetical protein
MKCSRIAMIAALVAALAVPSAAALAKSDKAKGGDNKAKEVKQSSSHTTETTSTTPPGWSKGKKTGWAGGKYPPGWSKWDGKKRDRWVSDRDGAIHEIGDLCDVYKIPIQKKNEISAAFDEAIVGGLMIDDARKRLVSGLKDEDERRALMVDTTKSVLDLLK